MLLPGGHRTGGGVRRRVRRAGIVASRGRHVVTDALAAITLVGRGSGGLAGNLAGLLSERDSSETDEGGTERDRTRDGGRQHGQLRPSVRLRRRRHRQPADRRGSNGRDGQPNRIIAPDLNERIGHGPDPEAAFDDLEARFTSSWPGGPAGLPDWRGTSGPADVTANERVDPVQDQSVIGRGRSSPSTVVSTFSSKKQTKSAILGHSGIGSR